ncbi:unnamed protein product [Closterium sp. NIES-54]
MAEAKRVRLGFVGAGQMAEALARGMSAAGVVAASDMSAMDLSQERLAVFAEMGVAAKTTCKELAAASDVIFIAVKPHTVQAVLSELRDSAAITSTHLVVSIAAGVTIANLQQWAGDEAKIVRVMPNTPCLVGATAAAMSLGGKATAEDAALVRRMFEAVGKIQQVEEKLLDAVTGLRRMFEVVGKIQQVEEKLLDAVTGLRCVKWWGACSKQWGEIQEVEQKLLSAVPCSPLNLHPSPFLPPSRLPLSVAAARHVCSWR